MPLGNIKNTKQTELTSGLSAETPQDFTSSEETGVEVTEEVAVRKTVGKFHDLPTGSLGDIFTWN